MNTTKFSDNTLSTFFIVTNPLYWLWVSIEFLKLKLNPPKRTYNLLDKPRKEK